MQGLPNTILEAEFEEGFNSINDLLIHVYNGESFWYSVLNNEHPYTGLSKFESISDYIEHFSELHQSTRQFLIRQTDCDKNIHFTSRNGREMNNTINEIVLTVINHGTYHRGNISIMLRQQGFKSVSSDYAFYLNRIRNF